MKRSIARLSVLIVLFSALISFSTSMTVHAAGVCLSGTGTYALITSYVAVNAGDTVTLKIVGEKASDPVRVELDKFPAVPLLTQFGTGTLTASFTVPSAMNIVGVFADYGSSAPYRSITYSLSVNGGCSDGNSNGPLFSDGRLNSGDAAQSAAVYCDKGAVIVYYIGDPWQIVLHVTTAEIDRVPSYPAQNTLIKQNARVGVALYRLSSGELQINAPGDVKGPYSFTFTDCPRDH